MPSVQKTDIPRPQTAVGRIVARVTTCKLVKPDDFEGDAPKAGMGPSAGLEWLLLDADGNEFLIGEEQARLLLLLLQATP